MGDQCIIVQGGSIIQPSLYVCVCLGAVLKPHPKYDPIYEPNVLRKPLETILRQRYKDSPFSTVVQLQVGSIGEMASALGVLSALLMTRVPPKVDPATITIKILLNDSSAFLFLRPSKTMKLILTVFPTRATETHR